MSDLISRQAAIDAINKAFERVFAWDGTSPLGDKVLENVPSAQPEPSEITDEQAILHLRSTGWMQRHDKEMHESGLKERLADDSESYDSLIPHEDDGDIISRQAAIDALNGEITVTGRANAEAVRGYARLVADRLKRLPSAQPEQRWIPCSERLPEKGEYGKVLVTCIPSGGTLWTTVIIAHYSDLMGIAKPSFHIGNVGKNDFINITEQVTAWMPLPEPYMRGEQDGNQEEGSQIHSNQKSGAQWVYSKPIRGVHS